MRPTSLWVSGTGHTSTIGFFCLIKAESIMKTCSSCAWGHFITQWFKEIKMAPPVTVSAIVVAQLMQPSGDLN
ncbi:hypothetical protein AYJ58_20555 [Shewanella sp. Pdp11]|nr:hypothetical protein AYJ58_20555 [Shewanella sp. Pdp11]